MSKLAISGVLWGIAPAPVPAVVPHELPPVSMDTLLAIHDVGNRIYAEAHGLTREEKEIVHAN